MSDGSSQPQKPLDSAPTEGADTPTAGTDGPPTHGADSKDAPDVKPYGQTGTTGQATPVAGTASVLDGTRAEEVLPTAVTGSPPDTPSTPGTASAQSPVLTPAKPATSAAPAVPATATTTAPAAPIGPAAPVAPATTMTGAEAAPVTPGAVEPPAAPAPATSTAVAETPAVPAAATVPATPAAETPAVSTAPAAEARPAPEVKKPASERPAPPPKAAAPPPPPDAPVIEEFRRLFGPAIEDAAMVDNRATFVVNRQNMVEFAMTARMRGYDYPGCISGVDWPDEKAPENSYREAVYHLRNSETGEWLVLKARCPSTDPWLQSLYIVYRGADWPEREIYDLYGIEFRGHPDLRRILMPEDWTGHPLLKSYRMSTYYSPAGNERQK